MTAATKTQPINEMAPWREVADALGVPRNLVEGYIKRRLLPSYRPDRVVMIYPADLIALIRASKRPATKGPLAQK